MTIARAADAPAASSLKREARVLGVVSGGHFLAHFYVIVLPPLFPLLNTELGVSYAALGLLMTAMNVITSATQVPIGFLIDRFGARVPLALGLAIMGAAHGLAALAGSYWALFIAMLAVGLGNSVFHPADYAILAQQVAKQRLGRAFSVHTAAGHIGWALAPALVGVASLWWGWQTALVLASLPGLVMAAVVLASGSQLDGRAVAAPSAPGVATGWRMLLARPMLALFLFMLLAAMANGGLNNFSVSVLVHAETASLAEANTILTAFFIASALGILLGGVLADRLRQHETVISAGLVVGAVALILLASVPLPLPAVLAVFLVVGLVMGGVRPARDMMVERVAPKGSVGAVFGFVTVGLNVGGALSPILFGWLIDQGAPYWVFYGAALCLVLAIPCGLDGKARR
ncbi:MAG: MFS transporter [Alphaproteobacteria bacterium]|nr:MFS transporter [Alphaproteobacteria bacterium]